MKTQSKYLKKKAKDEKLNDEERFIEFIRKNLNSFNEWSNYIADNIFVRGLSVSKLAEAINVSNVNNVINRYINKIPPVRCRNYVISFAVLFDFNVDETDYMLTSKARMQELYAKDIEDAIWIFIINHNRSLPKDEKTRCPLSVFEELRKSLEDYIALDSDFFENRKTHKNTIEYVNSRPTDVIKADIISQTTKYEFIDYIREHFPDFRSRNQKLIKKIELYGINPSLDYSYYPKFREWYNKQRQSIIRGKRPDRDFLIALGLMKSQTSVAEIDRLLELAHMSPLHPKSLFEFMLVHYLNFSDTLGDYDSIYEQVMDEINNHNSKFGSWIQTPEMKTCMHYYEELRDSKDKINDF